MTATSWIATTVLLVVSLPFAWGSACTFQPAGGVLTGRFTRIGVTRQARWMSPAGSARRQARRMGGQKPAGERVPFDTSVPHIAQVYDYWLGGKDNFAADRAAAEQAGRSR
jgi:hypothetical protein